MRNINETVTVRAAEKGRTSQETEEPCFSVHRSSVFIFSFDCYSLLDISAIIISVDHSEYFREEATQQQVFFSSI